MRASQGTLLVGLRNLIKEDVYHLLIMFCCSLSSILAYELPYVNLGFTSFLDGGPLRPKPGYYWEQYTQCYTSNLFTNSCGKRLCHVPSPRLTYIAGFTELIYQSDDEIIGTGKWGVDVSFAYLMMAPLEKNCINMRSSGAGIGDLTLGAFLQWDMIYYQERPLFVHRAECIVSFPCGKNKEPRFTINPGNGVYYINPYWAATFYFTKELSASWRIYYLWNSKNPKTGKQPGMAVHLNYALCHELFDTHFHFGVNGYFLQQLY